MIAKERLAELELFQDVPDEALADMAGFCREVEFETGTLIFPERRPADTIYILLDGTVGLLVSPTSLPEPMTIALLKSRGLLFGWSAVVGAGYYTATAEAETEVRAIAVDGLALMDYLEQHPVIGFPVLKRVTRVVSQRLRIVRTLLLETVCD
jgi:CRP-like cAMP-binding protein